MFLEPIFVVLVGRLLTGDYDIHKAKTLENIKCRTDYRFTILCFECSFAISDKERQVENIFHRLGEVVWIDYELENIDGSRFV
jgi:hypothetical protein